MKESELFADCSCINCRIGRIEKRLKYIQNLIEPAAQSIDATDTIQDENNPQKGKLADSLEQITNLK